MWAVVFDGDRVLLDCHFLFLKWLKADWVDRDDVFPICLKIVHVHWVSYLVVGLIICRQGVEVMGTEFRWSIFLTEVANYWLLVNRGHLVTITVKVSWEIGWSNSYSTHGCPVLDWGVSLCIIAYSDRASIAWEHTFLDLTISFHLLFLHSELWLINLANLIIQYNGCVNIIIHCLWIIKEICIAFTGINTWIVQLLVIRHVV